MIIDKFKKLVLNQKQSVLKKRLNQAKINKY